MNRVKNLWKSGSKGKLIIIFGGFILTTVVCGFCGLLADFASPSDGVDEVPEIINSQEEDINVEPTITIADTYIPDNLIEAVNIVADGLGNNVLDIKETDLLSIENPKGDGVFVYVEQTRFSGVE